VIEFMVLNHQLSRNKACKLVGLSRSAFYKPMTEWAAKDAPVGDVLMKWFPHMHAGDFGSASRACASAKMGTNFGTAYHLEDISPTARS
jgi:hypothetical protein